MDQKIKELADSFFEWPTENKSFVTLTSALLFAEKIAELKQGEADNVLGSMLKGFEDQLLSMDETELESHCWHFQWNENSSNELNLYEFSDLLEMYKRDCETWETHHNGSCCVVERVRDKYIMPKVSEFLNKLMER